MQGQRSSVGSLPELLGFDHGSTSSDTGLDQQIHWNSMRNSSQNRIPDYQMSSDSSVGFLNAVNQPGQNLSGWEFGESSSRVGQGDISENDQKSEHGWLPPINNVCAGTALSSEGQHYGSSNILSLNNVDVNMPSNENTNGPFFVQDSGSGTIQQNLNMNSDFIADGDDDCQILECPNGFKSGGSVNEWMPSASSSSNPFGVSSGSGGFLVEENDGRTSCSLDGRRLSCKRKTLEGSAGQASGCGSSSHVQHAESSNLWHAMPARHNTSSNISIVAPTENNLGVNLTNQVNPILGLSVGQSSSNNPPMVNGSGTAESSRRNFRLRINSSHQQDSLRNNIFSRETDSGNSNISSSQHSLRWLPRNNSLDLRSASAIDNGNPQGQSAVHVSSLRRNPHSRWNGGSGAGSSSSFAMSGDRDATPYEESSSADVPVNISEHPMFIPRFQMRNSSRSPHNWNLAGGNIGNPGDVASTSHSSSNAGVHSSAPTWTPQRNPSQYPRRLSEYVRRSLLAADTDSRGQSSNYPSLHSRTSSSQDVALSSGSGNHGRHASSLRSGVLLDRHLDGAFGGSYSLRSLAAATEGRNRLMSEIRNVLDLMRRGESLRIEDVMILDQSVFLGMTDIHDRHRDMRLDVDNMSYEELLALEERIGNVSTGLSEETILKQLRQRKYISNNTDGVEAEPCCVCQEEYADGEDLGTLDCGHDFHAQCIKQWLTHKNLCPICKTAGLAKSNNTNSSGH